MLAYCSNGGSWRGGVVVAPGTVKPPVLPLGMSASLVELLLASAACCSALAAIVLRRTGFMALTAAQTCATRSDTTAARRRLFGGRDTLAGGAQRELRRVALDARHGDV